MQGTEYPVNDNFMELLFWIDAFKRRQRHAGHGGHPLLLLRQGGQEGRAPRLDPRPGLRRRIEAAGADRVLTMDLHSPQIQGFFKIPVDHLYAMPVLVDYFRKKQIPDLVVASPDVGFGKQAYRFAELMRAAGRHRQQGPHEPTTRRAEVLDIIGNVEGKNVLIVDDFTISGGTLIEMANACKERGAKDIYACVSHGVFSKGSAAKIAASPIKELVLTDTIGYRFEPLAPCCKVISVAGLFAEAILSIHRRESVSRLFKFECGTRMTRCALRRLPPAGTRSARAATPGLARRDDRSCLALTSTGRCLA